MCDADISSDQTRRRISRRRGSAKARKAVSTGLSVSECFRKCQLSEGWEDNDRRCARSTAGAPPKQAVPPWMAVLVS
jgi:hypothetical protein